MNANRRLASVGVLLAGALCAAPSVAAAQVRDCAPDEAFDLNFSGGTLKEYIAAIQKAQPCANIMLDVYEGDPRVPGVSLRAVPTLVAMKLVEGPLGEGTIVNVIPYADNGGITRAIRVRAQASPQSKALSSAKESSPPRRAAVFNLAEPLSLGRSADELLGAIEAGLSVFDEPKATIKFHQPTGLLIVRGTPDQISVINEVVEQLRGSSKVVSSHEQNLRDQLESMRFDLLQAQADYEFASQRESAVRDAVARTKDRVAAGAAGAEDLQAAELELGKAERDAKVAQARLLQAQQRIDRLEAELGRITGKRGDEKRR